ncbi:hypothetical protein [Sphingopyxis sp. LK2115]|jgi:hypothetical protein|nr:hypothetical protein [Sphingopyxis sp. LK2115]
MELLLESLMVAALALRRWHRRARRSIAGTRIDLPGGEQVGLSSRPAKS